MNLIHASIFGNSTASLCGKFDIMSDVICSRGFCKNLSDPNNSCRKRFPHLTPCPDCLKIEALTTSPANAPQAPQKSPPMSPTQLARSVAPKAIPACINLDCCGFCGEVLANMYELRGKPGCSIHGRLQEEEIIKAKTR